MTVRALERRLASVRQIEGIVSALRALALAQQREAQRHLAAIRTHTLAVAGAMADALRTGSPHPGQAAVDDDEGTLLIVVGTAQGFTGAFGDRLAEAAAPGPDEALLVIGNRTAEALREASRTLAWSHDMPAHAADVPALASQVADVVFDRITDGSTRRVNIVYAEPVVSGPTLRRRGLVPFDFSRVAGRTGHEVLTTLDPATLLSALVEEYVFTELCEVLMLGFAAESAARADAMSRAQTNVRRIAEDLHGQAVRARQAEVTTEILELGLRRRAH